MWKLLATITFLLNGQPAPEGPVGNPWVISHKTVFDTEQACKDAIADDDVSSLPALKLGVASNLPRLSPEADDFKIELSCKEATSG